MTGVSFTEAQKMLEELYSLVMCYDSSLDRNTNVLRIVFDEILVETTVTTTGNTLFDLPVYKVDVKCKSLGDELVTVIDKQHNVFTATNCTSVCDYLIMLKSTHVVQIRGKFYIN